MNFNLQRILGFIIIIIAIICLIVIYRSPDMLIPAGYDLAIDGYVISKNILLFIIWILIAQLGFSLTKNSENKK